MAQPTQLIYTDQSAALPDTFVLPPGLDLTLQSVVARIDGSGAAGSFYPSLAIYTQDGKLMARVRAATLYAAGDTGVVTWSPFLRDSAPAAPAPSGNVVQYAILQKNPFNFGGGMTAVAFTTIGGDSDGTIFTINGAGDLEIASFGVYLFVGYVNGINPTTPPANAQELDAQLTVVSGSSGNWLNQPIGITPKMFAQSLQAVKTGTIKPGGEPASPIHAVGAWDSAASFPVAVRLSLDLLDDNVSDTGTGKVKMSVLRLGDTFS